MKLFHPIHTSYIHLFIVSFASFLPFISSLFLTFFPLVTLALFFSVFSQMLSFSFFTSLTFITPAAVVSFSKPSLTLLSPFSLFFSFSVTHHAFSISPASHIFSFVIVAPSSFVHPISTFFKFLHFTLTSPSHSPGAHPYPQFSCSHSVTHITYTVLCVSPSIASYILPCFSLHITRGKHY